jgi:hypothetical protein
VASRSAVSLAPCSTSSSISKVVLIPQMLLHHGIRCQRVKFFASIVIRANSYSWDRMFNYFNYLTEIEETFVRRRGRNLFLSPIDWAMMEDWQRRGIPLHIVIRGIETVFDGYDKNPGPRTIKSLLYCREEIEAQYVEWAAMQAGRTDAAAAVEGAADLDNVRRHIDSAIATLRGSSNESLRDDLERACVRLVELKEKASEDLETLDGSLADIEKLLDTALLTKTDKQHLKNVKKEVSAMLRAHKNEMEPATYDRTVELMLLKKLREKENVPRLGLFYL